MLPSRTTQRRCVVRPELESFLSHPDSDEDPPASSALPNSVTEEVEEDAAAVWSSSHRRSASTEAVLMRSLEPVLVSVRIAGITVARSSFSSKVRASMASKAALKASRVVSSMMVLCRRRRFDARASFTQKSVLCDSSVQRATPAERVVTRWVGCCCCCVCRCEPVS